jgi:hypothetical protein
VVTGRSALGYSVARGRTATASEDDAAGQRRDCAQRGPHFGALGLRSLDENARASRAGRARAEAASLGYRVTGLRRGDERSGRGYAFMFMKPRHTAPQLLS